MIYYGQEISLQNLILTAIEISNYIFWIVQRVVVLYQIPFRRRSMPLRCWCPSSGWIKIKWFHRWSIQRSSKIAAIRVASLDIRQILADPKQTMIKFIRKAVRAQTTSQRLNNAVTATWSHQVARNPPSKRRIKVVEGGNNSNKTAYATYLSNSGYADVHGFSTEP